MKPQQFTDLVKIIDDKEETDNFQKTTLDILSNTNLKKREVDKLIDIASNIHAGKKYFYAGMYKEAFWRTYQFKTCKNTK